MVYVRVEIWPRGDKTKARLLGQAFIANDASGTPTRGNYKAILTDRRNRPFRAAVVKNFPRKARHVFDLLKLVLGNSTSLKAKRVIEELDKNIA
jgi:hypothetical protein